MLASRSIENVMTRVMSAWNASAIRSNISLKCSVRSFGVPTGASGISRLDMSCRGGHLHAALDLADRVEVVADDDAVADAEAGLQPRRLSLDAVEDAAGLVENRRAFLVGVALAEQLLKHRARIAFLRQRLCRRPPGQARAAERRGQLERRQPRLLPDVPRRQLVGADAGVRTAPRHAPHGLTQLSHVISM